MIWCQTLQLEKKFNQNSPHSYVSAKIYCDFSQFSLKFEQNIPS